jgi:hypothetical protein
MVNRMELHNTTIPAKTYFKVVADKRIAVAVGGGSGYLGEVHAFYPSTDGGFAGKEFIFMAFPGTFDSYYGVGNIIYAIEDAKVTIYDDKGAVVLEREVKANETLPNLKLFARRVYRVVSTGRVMVASWGARSFTVAPSIMGGYLGRYFFINPRTISSWGTVDISAVIFINQGEKSRISVREVGKASLMAKEIAPKNAYLLDETAAEILSKNLIVESTGDILVFVTSTWRLTPSMRKTTQGVAFFGLKANYPATLYTFSKAIAFSPEANAHVKVGDLEIDIKKGGYIELPGGLITLESNSTLIVETFSIELTYISQELVGGGAERVYEVPALNNWAVYLISPESAYIVYQPPVIKRGIDIAPIVYGVVGIAVFVIIFLWKRIWRKQPFGQRPHNEMER